MLTAEHRLRRSDEFTTAVRRGATARRSAVVVHAAVGGDGPSRVGFVVGRAVGGAVVRNAVRRRLRHLVAARLDEIPLGSTVVVRALPGAASSSRRSLESDLERALATAVSRAEGRGR